MGSCTHGRITAFGAMRAAPRMPTRSFAIWIDSSVPVMRALLRPRLPLRSVFLVVPLGSVFLVAPAARSVCSVFSRAFSIC